MTRKICPETAKLAALVSDQADLETVERLIAHIDGCPECVAHLAELENKLFEHKGSTHHLKNDQAGVHENAVAPELL